MGQKVNPNGFRVGVNKPWKSVWYANKKEYREQLIEDIKIRKFLKDKLMQAGLSRIGIERMGTRIRITLNTSHAQVSLSVKKVQRSISSKKSLRNIQTQKYFLLSEKLKSQRSTLSS